MQRFQTSQWVPFPLEKVFAFFADPANLPRLMPPNLKTRIDEARIKPPSVGASSTSSVVAGVGSEMMISFRPIPLIPFRVRWTARIVEFAWNSHFCDEQVSGPFAAFRHCHRLHAERRDGVEGSLVNDEIEFEMPLGVLGRGAGIFVRRNLASSFAYRQKRLPELLGQLRGA